MKSQRLGLQPIKNYERVVNPRKKRFHMSSRMNSHGKIIITKIADYESNYIKKAGLLEGDEIIAINEIPIKMRIKYCHMSDLRKLKAGNLTNGLTLSTP